MAAHYLGTGNPGDEGKQLGVTFTIVRAGKGNTYATVHRDHCGAVVPPRRRANGPRPSAGARSAWSREL